MNSLRRKLLFVGGMAAIPMSMGCFSAALVVGATSSTTEYYGETFSSVLLSADGKTLAVIGEKYHYLFSAPQELKAVLREEFGQFVQPAFIGFNINTNQEITGYLRLTIAPDTPTEARAAAQAAGFKIQGKGTVATELKLEGKRYASGGIKATDSRQQLRKPYQLQIGEPKGPGIKMAALALTPITIAIDGILILVVLPLALLFKR